MRRARQRVEKGGPAEKAGVEVGRHHPQGRRPRSADLVGAAADHHDGQARAPRSRSRSGARARRRTSPSRSPRSRKTRRRTPSRAAGPRRRRRPSPTGWASCCPTSPTSRGRSSTSRAACWSRTSRRRVRGNVQPGDIDPRDRERGRRPRRRTPSRSTTLLAKLEKGASVTLQLRRGEQRVLRPTLRAERRMTTLK